MSNQKWWILSELKSIIFSKFSELSIERVK